MELLAKDVLHFESPIAIQHFFKWSDTHKTYQSSEIFFYGTALEIIHAYVNGCQDQATVEGFLSWNPNSTYHAVRQLVFNFALAITITKTGNRHNDVRVHEPGRHKFMDLFIGFNHPTYQEIEYRDLRQKTVMPSEVLEQRNKNLTYAISEKEGKHYGRWFHIRRKSLMPKNVDIERKWHRNNVAKCISKLRWYYKCNKKC